MFTGLTYRLFQVMAVCSTEPVHAGLGEVAERSVKSFDQQVSSAAFQLKQAAQAGSSWSTYDQALQKAQRFEHLSGVHAQFSICQWYNAGQVSAVTHGLWYEHFHAAAKQTNFQVEAVQVCCTSSLLAKADSV